MRKRTAFILFVSMIGLFSCAGKQAGQTGEAGEDEGNRVRFACENGERIEMRFFPARDLAMLIRAGGSIELRQQVSGSGIRYSNGPITVRGKGSEIRVEIGRMAPFRCEAL